MPIRVKSAADIAAKWARVSPGRDQDYREGVQDPGVQWARAAAGAAETYAAGVQEAITRGAFGKGVARSGDEKWRRKTADVGTQRWAPGIRSAQGDFESGFAPYREALEKIELPPRAPRGDPRNIERAAAVARALSERRKRG